VHGSSHHAASLFSLSLQLSVVHGCLHCRRSGLPSLRVLGRVCPNIHARTLYVGFPRTPQGFPLSMTLYRNFCSACAETVVIFRHFKSYFLLTYFLSASIIPSISPLFTTFAIFHRPFPSFQYKQKKHKINRKAIT